MEDWTDIFGEELKDIEETLPADDWAVVRQKYSAVQRRRKAAWWWSGAAASVAAVLALVLLLFRDTPQQEPQGPVIADNAVVTDSLEVIDTLETPTEDDTPAARLLSQPEDDLVADAGEPQQEAPQHETPHEEVQQYCDSKEDINAEEPEVEEPVFDVVRDTVTSVVETLMADSEIPGDARVDEPEPTYEWGFEDFPEEETKRRKVRMAVGMSATGGMSGGQLIPKMMDPMTDHVNPSPSPPDYDPDLSDSTGINTPDDPLAAFAPRRMNGNGKKVLSKSEDHHLPISYGVSARFTLTTRFSLNTGLNYTLYQSEFTTEYTDGSVLHEKQSAHYLGIPLRCDWMIVDKPYFGMYLGVGGQVDRCVYAKRAGERLYDDAFLFSFTAAAGLQYNINSRFSLYLEPEFSANLNKGNVRTYRTKHEYILTARAGLRINL